ncbi:hypothetical protein ACFVWT_19145 [Arthrobacter sp. NPDC058288]|uniref:hypothetical protein n=1 Tax=Arthrobacter sp. NPDC058288 TaxID=3346424 RepID=UPI0036DFC3A6
MTSQRAPFRLLRTAVVAAAVLCLAVGAHVLGGGTLPPTPVLAAVTALTVLCIVRLTKGKMNAPSLAAVLIAGQGILHEAFSALSGPATLPSAGPALHVHGAVPGPFAVPEMHQHLQAGGEPVMLALHLIATLLTAVLLERGEAALWALAALLRPLAGLFAVRMLVVARQPRPFLRQVLTYRWGVLRRPPLRGPPVEALI